MALWRMLFELAAAFAAGVSVKTLYDRERKLTQTLPGYSDGTDLRNTSRFDDFYLLLFFAFSAVMPVGVGPYLVLSAEMRGQTGETPDRRTGGGFG